ncbi:sce7726 family protein [Macrococcoides canis]|uniref:sce7726 family protein n=1 Tax=Macrococcoides canis TaxID=1855823 RepID=UPI001AEC2F23|nr:sce7726 family protein [Macrococcus canis]QTQ08398.1 sce7726 family protein [Macrococcus canis]
MNNNIILNRVFSKVTIEELITTNRSNILDRAYEKYFKEDADSISNISKFEKLYYLLNNTYRNEYYYKNTIINKILIGKHSVNTTFAMAEQPINKSKADIVIINGKAVVYEIKTKLDSLQRLHSQILDYYTVFDHVEILIDESHLEKVLEIYKDSTVGISVLTKRNTISQKKKPKKNREHLNHHSIYKVLRKYERKEILQRFYEKVPEYDQFTEYKLNLLLFEKIEIESLYEQFLKILKKRNVVKNNEIDFLKIPYELKSLIYFSKLKEKEYYRLNNALEEEIHVLSIS